MELETDNQVTNFSLFSILLKLNQQNINNYNLMFVSFISFASDTWAVNQNRQPIRIKK